MHQDTQLEKYYPKNKKENRNLSLFYQEQCQLHKETMKYMTRNYWLQLKLWINGNNTYQMQSRNLKYRQTMKISNTSAPLHPLSIPQVPWEEITVDVIRPLPRSDNKDTISVIVDYFSKMIRLIATTTSISLAEVARIYWDNIWKLHSIPKKIISNRGPQFSSTFMGELCKALGIKRAMSTAYYSQSDRQTERINQEVKIFLQYYINYQQDNWTKQLATVEFQYNDKEHAATNHTLFYLNYRRYPWKENLTVDMEIPSLEEFLNNIKKT